MNEIIEKRMLSEGVIQLTVYEPRIAAKCQAGQFFMLRVTDRGERVPFTFSDWSREEGWIRFIFMVVGKTTSLLSELAAGDYIKDLAGPLGRPSLRSHDTRRPSWGNDFEGLQQGGSVVVVGGGVGTAVAFPVARALCEEGYQVHVITGARTAELLILEEELRALPLASLSIMTDDGSAGSKGLVTAPLKELCSSRSVSHAIIVGPAIMMKFAAGTALDAGVPATVSLNPLMIDGTGMCGACRVSIDGATKFACVDGPDFSAASVDWAELMSRQRSYIDDERESHAAHQRHVQEREHENCDCFDESSLWARGFKKGGWAT
ncbi:MAG: sulfide/dihydroorotate dehydrogenase-like FAD/NAD-binding protein [Coriobacteriia bacterium]|nr:sulfide/dihydroorotate dehydrogenase-like FAD/NAD-binding protein [Coriobacteriia bacterium]MCL2537417.1 sulfide/dihydroorotate dehydrogenase-like FAD/NAD-binding protein [Coriobacteriia bacterium]